MIKKELRIFYILCIIALFLSSCSKTINKSIFEELSSEELKKDIKQNSDFETFYNETRDSYKFLLPSQKEKYYSITYTRLLNFQNFIKNEDYWLKEVGKWILELKIKNKKDDEVMYEGYRDFIINKLTIAAQKKDELCYHFLNDRTFQKKAQYDVDYSEIFIDIIERYGILSGYIEYLKSLRIDVSSPKKSVLSYHNYWENIGLKEYQEKNELYSEDQVEVEFNKLKDRYKTLDGIKEITENIIGKKATVEVNWNNGDVEYYYAYKTYFGWIFDDYDRF